MFWREDNGVHAERLAHGSIYLAADMRGLLDTILSEWSAAPEQRTELAAGSGLPPWLQSAVARTRQDRI
jgi:hypothetical protein